MNEISGRRKYWPDIIAMLFLMATSLKLYYFLLPTIDVHLSDESNYLQMGANLLSRGLPHPSWSPLYSVWYFILMQASSDPVKLYFLNQFIMFIAPVLMMFIFLRSFKVDILLSFLASTFYMVSYANLNDYKIPYLIFIIVATGIIIDKLFVKRKRWTFLLFSFISLIASYLRPELFISFLLFSFLFFYFLYREREEITSYSFLKIAGVILLVAWIINVFGLPMFHNDNRSFLAFSQHLSNNIVKWENLAVDPWAEHVDVTKGYLKGATTVREVLAKNPVIFMKHVGYNLLMTPPYLARQVFYHVNFILPNDFHVWNRIEGISLFASFMVLIGIYYKKRKHVLIDKMKLVFRENRRLIFILGIIHFPVAISLLIIHPRSHYLIMPAIFVIFLSSLFINSIYNSFKVSKPVLGAVYIVTFLLVPFSLLNFFQPPLANQQTNLKIITAIRELNIESPVNLLALKGYYHVYLPENYHSRFHEGQPDELLASLNNNEFGLIIVEDYLFTDKRFRDNESWKNLLDNFEQRGYVEHQVKGVNASLLIKRSLLGIPALHHQ